MFKTIGSFFFGLFLIVAGLVLQAGAQETKDLQAAFGSVVKTSATEIVISQYNSEKEADEEATYAVDPQTHFDGATTVTEIATGEEVEILYEEMEGRKVARFISKELLPEEDISSDEEQPDTMTDDISSNATSNATLNATGGDL